MVNEIKTQVVIIGSGPSGYSAAFRCADLGLKTIIVEKYNNIGGVCLNVGCIPSKALLHIAKIIEEIKILNKSNIFSIEDFKINIDKVRSWKEKAVNKLVNGLNSLAKDRKIQIINGLGKFTSNKTLKVISKNSDILINFEYAIIAAGSKPIKLSLITKEDNRIWYSTDALKLMEIPKNMLIIGGGIIGLEIGTVYHALGSKIDVVEALNELIPNADEDIRKIFTKNISKKFNLMLETKITAIESKDDGIYVSIKRKTSPDEVYRYDVLLIAIGREPNGNNLDADKAGVEIDKLGFIRVDKQMRTNIHNIFAVGDIVGKPMLAHKGIHEGYVAAEVIAGLKHYFEAKVIPFIAYTSPEVAWVGLNEKEAEKKNINYESAIFPWSASGRAISSGYNNGMTKLIFDKDTNSIIGGAIIGSNSSELLGEICLAIEMASSAEDISLTVHAHPTLHESISLAAKIFEGSITDLLNIKTKKV